MSKAYLLIICLFFASLSGCITDDEPDLMPTPVIEEDDMIEPVGIDGNETVESGANTLIFYTLQAYSDGNSNVSGELNYREPFFTVTKNIENDTTTLTFTHVERFQPYHAVEIYEGDVMIRSGLLALIYDDCSKTNITITSEHNGTEEEITVCDNIQYNITTGFTPTTISYYWGTDTGTLKQTWRFDG